MQYRKVPHSTLDISILGLDTMTFGRQNSEKDVHRQLDLAISHGINIVDTAEMYPTPPESVHKDQQSNISEAG